MLAGLPGDVGSGDSEFEHGLVGAGLLDRADALAVQVLPDHPGDVPGVPGQVVVVCGQLGP